MKKIQIEREPSSERLQSLGVFKWDIWTKEISKFSWTYESSETCYFLEGDIVITVDDGESVHVGKNDLVTFPAHMTCVWDIRSPVKKHFKFE